MAFTSTESISCRRDFPSLARTLEDLPLAYLDGPAGTQVPQCVIDAVASYYASCNANAGGMFVTSEESDRMLQEARASVAALVGARSAEEISFGANMTTLAFSLSHALVRTMQPGDEIVITQLDHEANRGPWLNLEERGIIVREVELQRDGTLDDQDLERKLTPRTRLVAIGLASNALGTVNDIPRARELAKAAGAYLLVDAVHYAPHFPLDVATLDVDFLFCSAYKFYGPHVGILYSRPGLLNELQTDRLRTQADAAPYRIETGTLNHASIAGVKAAIEYIATWGEGPDLRTRLVSAMSQIAAYEHELARYYFDNAHKIPRVTVWGPDFSSAHRAPTVSVTIDGIHPARAARRLAEKGVLVWNGHFYAVRAIEVLGLADKGGVIRAGMSMYNTRDEIDRLLAGIEELARSA